MKIKDGFVLNKVAGKFMIIPVGENFIDFSSVITTNETGAFIWNLLLTPKNKDELLNALISEFEGASAEDISADIDEFISALNEYNILEL